MESSGFSHRILVGEAGRRLRQDDSDVRMFFNSGQAGMVPLDINGSIASFRSDVVMVLVFISIHNPVNQRYGVYTYPNGKLNLRTWW